MRWAGNYVESFNGTVAGPLGFHDTNHDADTETFDIDIDGELFDVEVLGDRARMRVDATGTGERTITLVGPSDCGFDPIIVDCGVAAAATAPGHDVPTTLNDKKATQDTGREPVGREVRDVGDLPDDPDVLKHTVMQLLQSVNELSASNAKLAEQLSERDSRTLHEGCRRGPVMPMLDFMKRIILPVLGGLVLTMLVSWVLALWSPIRKARPIPVTATKPAWFHRRLTPAPNAAWHHPRPSVAKGVGIDAIEVMAYSAPEGDLQARMTIVSGTRVRAGFPLLCVQGQRWCTRLGTDPWECASHGAFDLGASGLGLKRRTLPLQPLWFGFVANTLVYGAGLILAGRIARRLRTRRREGNEGQIEPAV